MIVLYFTSEEDFMYWLNYTEIFMVVKVLVDFKVQIELWRFASDSYKDWNKTGNWATVWYRLALKNTVFDWKIMK